MPGMSDIISGISNYNKIHPRHYEGTEYQKVTRSSLAALFILPSKLPDMPNPYTGEKPRIVPDKVLIPRCTQNLSQPVFDSVDALFDKLEAD